MYIVEDGKKREATPEEIAEIEALQKIASAFNPAEFSRMLNIHVDEIARAKGYQSALSLVSYSGSTNAAWRAEAEAFVKWRDAFWAHCLAGFAAYDGGPTPTLEAFLNGAPKVSWPA